MVSMLTNVQFGNWPLINLLHFPDSLILEESETFFNFKATNRLKPELTWTNSNWPTILIAFKKGLDPGKTRGSKFQLVETNFDQKLT